MNIFIAFFFMYTPLLHRVSVFSLEKKEQLVLHWMGLSMQTFLVLVSVNGFSLDVLSLDSSAFCISLPCGFFAGPISQRDTF